jgi:uncharacterized protein YfcZ (UPF0381/DUF406 family)
MLKLLGWPIAFAVLVFFAIFGLRLGYGYLQPGGGSDVGVTLWDDSFVSIGRKNYASITVKGGGSAAASAVGLSQKYEKIATIAQRTSDYEADKGRIDALVVANKGQVQLERAEGLVGDRILYLGIGVPPEVFDPFIAELRKIGRLVAITVVKNDKTNEYLQLRASRATLEKARASLETLAATGGSVDERVNVQSRLTEVEEKIQALGVSLGEFDSQNEFVTVKLTLAERAAERPISIERRLFVAFSFTVQAYAAIGLGFAALVAGFWALFGLVKVIRRQLAAA